MGDVIAEKDEILKVYCVWNQAGHFSSSVRSIGLLMLASLRLLLSINMSQNTIRMCRLSGE